LGEKPIVPLLKKPFCRNDCLAATRTLVLAGLLALVTSGAGTACADGVPAEGRQQALPPWTNGYLYIHHISTGRGNAAYIVMPDGTTMLIDAGEADPEFVKSVAPLKAFPPLPDATHSAGYWIANYIRQFAPPGRPVALDYALITHFHTDHIGTIRPTSPMSATGAYRLAGITEVGELVPIKTLIDRAAPNYTVPVDLRACAQSSGDDGRSLANYLDMVAYRKGHGEPVVGLQPGQQDQIRLQQAQKFADFHIRNIASSGVIWTGRGTDTQHQGLSLRREPAQQCHQNQLREVFLLFRWRHSRHPRLQAALLARHRDTGGRRRRPGGCHDPGPPRQS
jgi:hypothetical protein